MRGGVFGYGGAILAALAAGAAVAVDDVPRIEVPVSRPSTAPSLSPEETAAAEAAYAGISDALRQKNINLALTRATQAFAEHPDNPHVLRAFVDLQMSVAEWFTKRDAYREAEACIREALRAEPTNEAALDFIKQLEATRAAVFNLIVAANRELAAEFFGDALKSFRRVRSVAADRIEETQAAFVAAAGGAGDDHFLARNFESAFNNYELVVAEVRAGRSPPAALDAFAPQAAMSLMCEILSFAKEAHYSAGRWQALRDTLDLLTAASQRGPHAGKPRVGQISSGCDQVFEALTRLRDGDGKSAAEALRRFAAAPVSESDLARLRAAAAAKLLQLHDRGLCQRRAGYWRETRPGDWIVPGGGTPRFRLHHRNPRVAQQVAKALAVCWPRILRDLGLREQDIGWTRPCDLYVHADEAALVREAPAAATGAGLCGLAGGDEGRSVAPIHLHQADEFALSSTLPHQIVHRLATSYLKGRVGQPLIVEGLALNAECEARQAAWKRLAPAKAMRRPLAELLRAATTPGDEKAKAEAFDLVTFLLARGTPGDLLAVCGEPDVHAAIVRSQAFENDVQLDEYWWGRLLQTRPADAAAASP